MTSESRSITTQQMADLRQMLDEAGRHLARAARCAAAAGLTELALAQMHAAAGCADGVDLLRRLPAARPPEPLPSEHYDRDPT